MTLEQLGRRVGVTRQQMGRLEAGTRTLKPRTLEKIAGALSVPLANLEDESDLINWTAEQLRLLGFQIAHHQEVQNRDGVVSRVSMVGRLRVGPINVGVLVRCLELVTEDDITSMGRFLESSNEHIGLVVTRTSPRASTRAAAAELGINLLLQQELMTATMDLRPYAQRLVDDFQDQGSPYVEPECRIDDGSIIPWGGLLEKWLGDEAGQHLVLKGEPGVGKTTACQWTAHRLASAYLRDPGVKPLPVLINLWEYSYILDLVDLVAREVMRQNPLDCDFRPVFFNRMLAEGRVVVILDGLDEMATAHDRHLFNNTLRAVGELLQRTKFVMLTARTGTFAESANDLAGLFTSFGEWTRGRKQRSGKKVVVADLQRFSKDMVQQYLYQSRKRGWRSFLDKLDEYDLWELAGLPLALSMLDESWVISGSLPGSTPSLYDVISTAFQDWSRHESNRFSIPVGVVSAAMEDVAFALEARRDDSIPLDQLLHWFAQSGSQGIDESRESARAMSNSLFLTLDRDGNFRISHTLIKDFLVVRRLLRLIGEGSAWALEHVWIDPSKERLLQGQVELAPGTLGRLIEWLMSHPDAEKRAPAAYLLGLTRYDKAGVPLWNAFRQDADLAVQCSAAYSLARLGSMEAVEELAKRANVQRGTRVGDHARVQILLLLYLFRDSSVGMVEKLEPRLQELVAGWDVERFKDDLLSILDDDNETADNKSAVCRLLGNMGDRRHLPHLTRLLGHGNQRLRRAANVAISMLEPPSGRPRQSWSESL